MMLILKFLPLSYAPITGRFAETYRIVIAYSEKEIHTIKHVGVFYVDKAGFLRLGHKFTIVIVTFIQCCINLMIYS